MPHNASSDEITGRRNQTKRRTKTEVDGQNKWGLKEISAQLENAQDRVKWKKAVTVNPKSR